MKVEFKDIVIALGKFFGEDLSAVDSNAELHENIIQRPTMAATEAAFTELRASVESLKTELTEVKTKTDSTASDSTALTDLQKEVAEVKASNVTLNATIGTLSGEVVTLKNHVAELAKANLNITTKAQGGQEVVGFIEKPTGANANANRGEFFIAADN